MNNPFSSERFNTPCVCLQCWREKNWLNMKMYYSSILYALFLFYVPLMTLLLWVIHQLWLKGDIHSDTHSAFWVFILIPLILSIGCIPQIITKLWFISKYGPQLEVASGVRKQICNLISAGTYAVCTFTVFIVVVRVLYGHL